MRVERTLVALLFLATTVAPGCGRLAYNLPPASRLMEPGPGVGGPGPGVIPPAGSAYGMYGGAVGRFGNGMSSMMGGGGPCGPGAPGGSPCGGGPTNFAVRDGVMPANYECPCEQSGQCMGGSCPCGPGGCNCTNGGPCSCGPGCECGGGPGMMGGPSMGGPGIQNASYGGCMRPGSTEAYADGGGGGAGGFGMATSQVAFLGDDGVQVTWDISGNGMFDATPLVIPGRQDFYQGAIYRLKLTNIPGRAGVQLYPTLEIAPVTPRTDAYLAHSPIPVQFTEEDFDQVTSGNFVTKVIYLPDPEFQELALAGVETLVSTRLDPGVDPIAEADRRGSILAIVRIGNKDLEIGAGAARGPANAVVPAGAGARSRPSPATNNVKHASLNNKAAVNQPAENLAENPISEAQYCESEGPAYDSGPAYDGGPAYEGGAPCMDGGYGDGGYGYGDGAMSNMPVGMPTSSQAPFPVPPNMIAGGPQWGMPITGTPIGLPGPPHVPLGVPAGLQKHVIKNKTRVLLPPPVAKMEMTVKQRPGLNYPRPVDHVHVDETQREPFRLFPNWLTGAHCQQANECEPYPQR